jgi:DNA-binding SARP family transcriptional activator
MTTLIEMEKNDHLAPVMISLLGAFRLTLHGEAMPISDGSKSESLLTHLALARRRPLQRMDLLERLWPNYDPCLAGQSLNSLVYKLNKLVKRFSQEIRIIGRDNGHYYLNTGQGIGIDIDYFEAWCAKGVRLLRRGDVDRGLGYCEQALTLYQGDLTGDSNIQTVIERESLRAMFLNLLAALADHYTTKDPDTALTYIHRLLRHDPCREDAHRLAMRCYVRLDTRAQALRQYQLCRQILRAEFDALPEPATDELFDRIRLDPRSV